MQARFTPVALWTHLRSTYWFLPSLVTVFAIVLGIGLAELDRHAWDTDALPAWFYGGGAAGARALLSAVAGSIITVVSVTFSVTIVALTVSSQHFGPRLLNNFMRDTAAQLVLGMFIGTFAYCLVVLRTVQGDGEGFDEFVPHLAVTCAVALTLVSVATLIYYVHHVATSMQVSEIVRGVVAELEEAIDRLYPEDVGREPAAPAAPPEPSPAAFTVRFRASGYLQHVEADHLLDLACRADVVIWLLAAPGSFGTEGLPLAVVEPRPADPESFAKALNGAIVLGSDRTAQQDVGFPIQQLVEVTLHALSSGLNEPFTAVTCVDRLGQGFARLATRRFPSPVRADGEGRARVIARRESFGELLDGAIDPIRAHLDGNPEVGTRLLHALAAVAATARREEDAAAVAGQADLVRAALGRWDGDTSYGPRIAGAHRRVRAAAPPDPLSPRRRQAG